MAGCSIFRAPADLEDLQLAQESLPREIWTLLPNRVMAVAQPVAMINRTAVYPELRKELGRHCRVN
jgi:hypothetical protein